MMSSRWSTALYAAAAAVLIILLALVWTHPAVASAAGPRPQPAPAAAASARGGDPCSAVIGPAQAVCNGNASVPALPHLASVELGRGAVLLPATVAVATAIALALLAERRAR